MNDDNSNKKFKLISVGILPSDIDEDGNPIYDMFDTGTEPVEDETED